MYIHSMFLNAEFFIRHLTAIFQILYLKNKAFTIYKGIFAELVFNLRSGNVNNATPFPNGSMERGKKILAPLNLWIIFNFFF